MPICHQIVRTNCFGFRRTVMLICVAAILSALPEISAQAQSDQELGQTLGNLLGAIINNAIQQSVENSWQKLDPAVLDCMEGQYNIAPGQLAASGISANDSRMKPYVEECKRLTAPPPVVYRGYREDAPGSYVRTTQGLAHVGSRYFVRVTASEVGNASPDALLNAVPGKAGQGCTGEYSVAEFQFFDGTDAYSKARDLREPYLFAEIECATESQDGTDTAAGVAIDELTKDVPTAEYFTLHTVTLNAGYDATFAAAVRALKSEHCHIVRSDKDKGIIVTDESGTGRGCPERYFAALDPVTDTSTRLTFKLVAGTNSIASPGHAAFFVVEDRDTENSIAEKFGSAVQRALER